MSCLEEPNGFFDLTALIKNRRNVFVWGWAGWGGGWVCVVCVCFTGEVTKVYHIKMAFEISNPFGESRIVYVASGDVTHIRQITNTL